MVNKRNQQVKTRIQRTGILSQPLDDYRFPLGNDDGNLEQDNQDDKRRQIDKKN
jgi:hypothetical protein